MKDIKLYDIDSSELNELIDSSKVILKTKNKSYKDLQEKVSKITNSYPNILAIIEDNEIDGLNKEECKNLQKLISLYLEMVDYEDREIFFLGARENYYYFKNLGLIKE